MERRQFESKVVVFQDVNLRSKTKFTTTISRKGTIRAIGKINVKCVTRNYYHIFSRTISIVFILSQKQSIQ